jgi:DNA-binding transcriptional LysR family regulator
MNKFEDMQAFIRIVEAGSITKAAAQLNIAKSALSKRLSTLESRLGLSLINRTTRSLKLTDNGRVYYQQCQRIVDDVVEMESDLQNKQCALSGSIKIAAPLSFGLSHLAPCFNEFNSIHPKITFEIDFNDRKIAIINEGYDLAIRIGQLDDSSLMARKITTVKTTLVASDAYLRKFGTPKKPKDLLKNHHKLHYKNTTGTFKFKTKDNKTTAINLPSALVSNNGNYLCQAAINGMGIINSPDFICNDYLESGQLRVILADSFIASSFGVYALYPQTRHLNRRVRSLIDYLVEYFQ